jgi:uncharacterized membrane-anchored protein YitT (DUF2179 family)
MVVKFKKKEKERENQCLESYWRCVTMNNHTISYLKLNGDTIQVITLLQE